MLNYLKLMSFLFVFILINAVFYSEQNILRNLETDVKYSLSKIHGNSNVLGYYYTTFYIGENKEPQTLLLDTSSLITSAVCKLCTNCGTHYSTPYNVKETEILSCYSSTCQSLASNECINNQCRFTKVYEDNSLLEGVFNAQIINFEIINTFPFITDNSFELPIGCTTKETLSFSTIKTDGILGLGNDDSNFVSLAYKNNRLLSDVFSICLGQKDGYFSMGKIDSQFHKSNFIQYINLIKNEEEYLFQIKTFKINEVEINNFYLAKIDSSSTSTYIPKRIYTQIVPGIISYCNKVLDNTCTFRQINNMGYCIDLRTKKEVINLIFRGLPDIEITVGDTLFTWKGSNYYLDMTNNDSGTYRICLGLQEQDENSPNLNKIVLGTTFLHGYDFIFDLKSSELGFVEADCNRGILPEGVWKDEEPEPIPTPTPTPIPYPSPSPEPTPTPQPSHSFPEPSAESSSEISKENSSSGYGVVIFIVVFFVLICAVTVYYCFRKWRTQIPSGQINYDKQFEYSGRYGSTNSSLMSGGGLAFGSSYGKIGQ